MFSGAILGDLPNSKRLRACGYAKASAHGIYIHKTFTVLHCDRARCSQWFQNLHIKNVVRTVFSWIQIYAANVLWRASWHESSTLLCTLARVCIWNLFTVLNESKESSWRSEMKMRRALRYIQMSDRWRSDWRMFIIHWSEYTLHYTLFTIQLVLQQTGSARSLWS